MGEGPFTLEDQADYPTYAASSYANVVTLLPLCANVRGCFERQEDHYWKQVSKIYFTVEGSKEILTEA